MQKKIACVNDISGIGKCSLSVALPIISALKCQCCPLPTSVLSSQTGYPKYTFTDLTDTIQEYIDVWQQLGQTFDTIYSGFLGSSKQIKLVESLVENNPDSFVVVDPVLGDLGVLFPIFSSDDINEMRKLVSKANLITPNITEANLLLERKIDNFDYNDDDLLKIATELSLLGPEYVIITGITDSNNIYNFCYDNKQKSFYKIGNPYNKFSFSGTGDIFTSIVTAMITRGFDINTCVKISSDFIYKAVEYTSSNDHFDRNDGINFEEFLCDLVVL